MNVPLLACLMVSQLTAQTRMAPLDQYLMDREAEITLARSAAPRSVGQNAEVLTLTAHGFQTAAKGSNGFVCLVARSWNAEFDDPDFWNPRLRVPICYNAIGAKSQVAMTRKRTEIALAGGSADQMLKAMGDLPIPEPGAMAYMLSNNTYFGEHMGHWLPHLMFFTPQTDPKAWGAGQPGSPVMGVEHPAEHSTTFLVPLTTWSDGTLAATEKH